MFSLSLTHEDEDEGEDACIKWDLSFALKFVIDVAPAVVGNEEEEEEEDEERVDCFDVGKEV